MKKTASLRCFARRRRRLSGSSATFGRQARPKWPVCLGDTSPIALLRFASQGRLRRDESAEWWAAPRTTLRRAVPSFTVEVRRRPRLATTSNRDAQSSETSSSPAGLDRESHRAAAATFSAKKLDQSSGAVASSPRGRILPSLVPDESLRRMLRDAAPASAESDPPSRAPKRTSKGKDQASRLPRNLRFSSEESAPLAERLSTKSRRTASVQSDEEARVSPRVATTARSQVVGDAGGLALSAKAKRRTEMAISRDDVRAKPLPNDQRSMMATDSPATLPWVTIVHLKVESEPSWLATSSAMNSNPASVGSGGCARRDEAPLPRCSWWSIPDPSRREPSRSALTFRRSTPALLSARTS